MRYISVTIILIGCWLNLAICDQYSNGLNTEDIDHNHNYEIQRAKRYGKYGDRYGMDTMSYTYNGGSEVKRLPVYNFGLGKRARPYSFGLGKRADMDYYYYDDYDRSPSAGGLSDAVLDPILGTKRNRPYSFGLGKREGINGEKRKYDFGLGKRDISNDKTNYDFGMGKREVDGRYPFNFGLGKRDVQSEKRYDFGLGKR